MSNVIPITFKFTQEIKRLELKAQQINHDRRLMFNIAQFMQFLTAHNALEPWIEGCNNHLSHFTTVPMGGWVVSISFKRGGDEFWWPIHEAWLQESAKLTQPKGNLNGQR